MDPLAAISPSGRLGRESFTAAVIMVYAASFASHSLLAAPVTAYAGLWAFAAAQAGLVWVWYVIHARRLRDAGRHTGPALGIALVYALAIVLLLQMLSILTAGGSGGAQAGPALLHFFAIIYLLGRLSGDTALGTGFGVVVAALLALIFVPIAIALMFTVHTAMRRPAP